MPLKPPIMRESTAAMPEDWWFRQKAVDHKSRCLGIRGLLSPWLGPPLTPEEVGRVQTYLRSYEAAADEVGIRAPTTTAATGDK